MRKDAKNESWGTCEWTDANGNIHPCLFCDSRIDRNSVPKGWHLYEVRDDGCSGDWCEIALGIMVNFWGSIVTQEEINFEEYGAYTAVADYSYTEDDAADALYNDWTNSF